MSGGARRRIATLGGLTAIGSLGIQMVVPALPQVAAELAVTDGAAALLVSVYLGGLAAAQLAWGPVAEAIGRRPLLVGGALAFAAASLMAWRAPGLEVLLVARAAQAVAAAAALVAARAMVADAPGGGASAMAYLMAIVMLSPVAAPVIGGSVAIALGWRAIFAALAITALTGALVAWRDLPETLDERVPLSVSAAAGGWATLARSAAFRRNAGAAAFTSGGLYSYMTLSPFLYTGLYHLPAGALGLHYGLVASGAAVGATMAGRLLRHRPAIAVLRGGAALLGGAAVGVAAVTAWSASAWPLTAAMALFAFASGLVAPSATAGAIAAPGVRRATASGVHGTLQMSLGALASLLAAALPHAPLTLALLMGGTTMAAMVASWRAPRASAGA